MHSSALGAAAWMVLRSLSSAARLSLLKAARYSSMVFVLALLLGLGLMAWPPSAGGGAPATQFASYSVRLAISELSWAQTTASRPRSGAGATHFSLTGAQVEAFAAHPK